MKRGVHFIGVGVGAIIVAEDGRLLLSRRGPTARNECGLWEFPGGAVASGSPMP
ncbi:MAG: NUDIX domain-containing protein [Gemmatimonadales bacterium]